MFVNLFVGKYNYLKLLVSQTVGNLGSTCYSGLGNWIKSGTLSVVCYIYKQLVLRQCGEEEERTFINILLHEAVCLRKEDLPKHSILQWKIWRELGDSENLLVGLSCTLGNVESQQEGSCVNGEAAAALQEVGLAKHRHRKAGNNRWGHQQILV